MKADLDIGSLIYVLLTVVFLVVGAVGKKKKPAPERKPELQDEPQSGISFDAIMRELNPLPVAPQETEYSFSPETTVEDGPAIDTVPGQYSPVDTIPEETVPVDNTFSYTSYTLSELDSSSAKEGTSVFASKTGAFGIPGEDPEEADGAFAAEISSDFDARKAFVYSEIFKPKYF